MNRYDAIIVGAGSAGLVAGALLTKLGKKVVVLEKGSYLGGRALTVPHEGYKLMLGGHLLEDTGSGLTKIMEYLGLTLEHGKTNTGLAIYHEGAWKKIQELYDADKSELKKIIKKLIDSDYDEFEKYDNQPLRTWLLEHTNHEGVIALFEFLAAIECLTHHWYDHSASDNLFVRKMHYQEKKMAGYSCWPVGGFEGIYNSLQNYIENHHGEVLLNTPVSRVLIEKGEVKGVNIEKYLDNKKATPNEYPEIETLLSDHVIVTVPVWDFDIIEESYLPDWFIDQVKLIAQPKYRVSWLGLNVATREPLYVNDPGELYGLMNLPHSKLSGHAFLQSEMDPDTVPDGAHLLNCGGAFQGVPSKRWIEEHFDKFEKDMELMFPGYNEKNIIWKRRHLVCEQPFGVTQKPGLVGLYRPDNVAPNVQGLFFAGETYRSRGVGIDRAARSALTVVEKILGERIGYFNGTWRY